MKKRLISLLLVSSLFLSLAGITSNALAAVYPDIAGHWAQSAIERWSSSGILKGYSDGRFAPDDSITRAQLSEILYRVWGCQPNLQRVYSDVSPAAWYYQGVTTMATYGVTPTQNGQVHPDEVLTREEAFYMLARAFGVGNDANGVNIPTQVSDGADISLGYRDRLTAMFNAKHLKGGSDGAFQPQRNVTRAEVIQVLDNLFDLYIDQPGTYNLGRDQVALITVPGVTLNTTKGRNDPTSHVYVMAPAFAGDGPTLTNAGGGTVHLHGVCDQNPVWNTEGIGFWVDSAAVLVLSDPRQIPHLSFASGTGTLADPYHIATADQFRTAMDLPTNPAGDTMRRMTYYFTLDNDIDLGPLTGSLKHPFYFHLDGGGHTLTYQMSGTLTSSNGQLGLFDVLLKWNSVHDLTLVGTVDVTLTDPTEDRWPNHFGGLAGIVQSDLTNCHSKLAITVHCPNLSKDLNIGGLAGSLRECAMTGCTSQATIQVIDTKGMAEYRVGGLAGVMSQSIYSNSQTVSGRPDLPTPEELQSSLRQCGSSATIRVTGGDHVQAGGLVGLVTARVTDAPEGYGVIEQCWSTAHVSTANSSFQADCGGLVGQLYAGTIRQCWSVPTLQIDTDSRFTFQNLGGIAGSSGGKELLIADCWADVSGLTVPQGDGHYGGITGRLGGQVTRCLVLGNGAFAPQNAISYASWTDTAPTGCFAAAGHTAQELSEFLASCGWDFTTVWDASGPFPILRALPAQPQRDNQTGGLTTGKQVLI